MMTDQSQMFDQNKDTSAEGTQQAADTNANPDKGEIQPKESVDMNAVYADQLSAITTEDGQPKYKDVSTALHALKASQDFIETLKTENTEFKEKAQKADTLEQVVESFKNSQNSNDSDQLEDTLAVEDIEKIVANTITQRESQNLAAQNQATVVQTLQKEFGDKAEEKYLAKAQELGLPASELDNLSSMSPSAVLKYFEADMKAQSTVDKNINSSVNTEAFNQQPQTTERKPIMNGASTEDMLAAWRASAAKVEQPSQ